MTAARHAPEDFEPLSEDALDGPLPVREVAAYAGVSEAAIRQWKRRGKIHPAGLDEYGRPMYRLLDVWRVQGATRRLTRAS